MVCIAQSTRLASHIIIGQCHAAATQCTAQCNGWAFRCTKCLFKLQAHVLTAPLCCSRVHQPCAVPICSHGN